MITIIINDRGVLQAFKWFKQQRHTECARIEIVGVVANPDVLRPAVTLLILASNAQRRLAIDNRQVQRSEEHTSELQSLMRISYAVFCLKKKRTPSNPTHQQEKPKSAPQTNK